MSKPVDTLTLGVDADLSMWSYNDAKGLLIDSMGEGAHYMLVVHPKRLPEAQFEFRYYPKLTIQTHDQDDIDEWMLIAFKYDKGFQHKVFWSPGA